MFNFVEKLVSEHNRKKVLKAHRDTMKFIYEICKDPSINEETREQLIQIVIDLSNERLKFYSNR